MAIYDGLIFNELDLLDIWLRELEQVVDRFVLVEAPVTFSGRPKPLYFADQIGRFARWRDRITHVVVDDMPTGPDPWRRAQHQRNAILRGLNGAAPDDGVIVSDCDEIPSADAVRRWPGDGRTFDQLFSYYWINCVGGGWSGSRIVPMRELQRLGGPHAVAAGLLGGQCPRLTDYVTVTGPRPGRLPPEDASSCLCSCGQEISPSCMQASPTGRGPPIAPGWRPARGVDLRLHVGGKTVFLRHGVVPGGLGLIGCSQRRTEAL